MPPRTRRNDELEMSVPDFMYAETRSDRLSGTFAVTYMAGSASSRGDGILSVPVIYRKEFVSGNQGGEENTD